MTKFALKFFKYLKGGSFLPDYCGIPYSSATKHKMRGKDGNGKEIDFSDEEKRMIREGVKKYIKQLINELD